jgi:hypothetical protein
LEGTWEDGGFLSFLRVTEPHCSAWPAKWFKNGFYSG